MYAVDVLNAFSHRSFHGSLTAHVGGHLCHHACPVPWAQPWVCHESFVLGFPLRRRCQVPSWGGRWGGLSMSTYLSTTPALLNAMANSPLRCWEDNLDAKDCEMDGFMHKAVFFFFFPSISVQESSAFCWHTPVLSHSSLPVPSAKGNGASHISQNASGMKAAARIAVTWDGIIICFSTNAIFALKHSWKVLRSFNSCNS